MDGNMLDQSLIFEKESPEKVQMITNQADKDFFKEFKDILTEEDIDYGNLERLHENKLANHSQAQSSSLTVNSLT